MEYTESEKKTLEETKLSLDYLKHLTTLSTGSLLLVITFVDQIFEKPEWMFVIGITLLGFIISIVSSVAAMTATVLTSHVQEPEGFIKCVGMIGVFGSWIGFFVGILSVTIFALKNLF